jgi:hypothetical protein
VDDTPGTNVASVEAMVRALLEPGRS